MRISDWSSDVCSSDLLQSDLTADAYWETRIRGTKRKEIRRLQNRLRELGSVTSQELSSEADIPSWCRAFLTLEQSGWKGTEGTAIACDPAEASCFSESVTAAFAAERLDRKSKRLNSSH